jgi:hypothetical protein
MSGPVYRGLDQSAREEIKGTLLPSGQSLTIAAYIRHHDGERSWGYGMNKRLVWTGDSCGCPDDRCIGEHHDSGEDCGCLSALLSDLVRDMAAA